MAKSANLILATAGIVTGTEFLQTGKLNLRVPVAGLITALLFTGVETMSEPLAVGLATIGLVTAVLTPINGKSAAETLLDYTQKKEIPQ